MTMAIERRRSPRYPAVETVALVLTGRRRPRLVDATLINIGATGALLRMSGELLRMSGELRPGATLLMGLVHPVRTPAMQATVARVGERGEVGIEFVHSCNRTLFWTATRGEVLRIDPREGDAKW